MQVQDGSRGGSDRARPGPSIILGCVWRGWPGVKELEESDGRVRRRNMERLLRQAGRQAGTRRGGRGVEHVRVSVSQC